MSSASAQANSRGRGAIFRIVVAAFCLAVAGVITAHYPVMPIVLAGALLVYCIALWRWPSLWLAVVPAVLPAWDLTPWTGWMLVGEFDLFALATIGILLLRAPPTARDFIVPGLPGMALVLSVSTCLVGIVLGITSPLDSPLQSDLLYLRPDNAFRLANGFVVALMLFPFLRERSRMGRPVAAWFAAGMLAGLSLVAAAAIVERALFPGIFNFTADYRVVATFSSMHLGGGHIGAYLAMTLPFLILCLTRPKPIMLLVMLCIAIVASYALVVTFARTAYVAAVVSTLLAGIGWIAASSRHGRAASFNLAMPALLIVIVAGFLAAAALDAGTMSARFTTLAPDFATREANWSGGLDVRDDTISATLFGMGLGTYPRAVFSRRKDDNIPSNFVVKQEGGQNYLSMATGAPDYFGQKIPVAPETVYRLSLDVRSPDRKATLSAIFCEKILLYSDNCRGASFIPRRPGEWEQFHTTISTVGMNQRPILAVLRRPVELSLFDGVPKSTIEIRHVRLIDPAGQDIIDNGDFTQGVQRWYFTDDNHLVWRMKDQYLMILFESGLLGLLSFFVLVGTAAWGALRAIRRGEQMGAAIAASLAAFLCSCLFDYLLEAPRIAALFYLVCFIGLTMWDDDSARAPRSA